MNPELRKRLVTAIVLIGASLIIGSMFIPKDTEPVTPEETPAVSPVVTPVASPKTETPKAPEVPATPESPNTIAAQADDSQDAPTSVGLAARAPLADQTSAPASLGSLNPDVSPFEINFSDGISWH